jgi:hypothetical protein
LTPPPGSQIVRRVMTATDDEPPLDPAAARMVARVKWLMVISGLTTMIAIAAVIGVIGYRVFRGDLGVGGAVTAAEYTALIPRGARVTATAVVEDRIVVTLDAGGATEIRTFDLRSLRPIGRLRFAAEP